MVGGQTTVLPSNPVTLGNSLGTLAESLRSNDLADAQKTYLSRTNQMAAQKLQDENDAKHAASFLERVKDAHDKGLIGLQEYQNAIHGFAKQFPGAGRFIDADPNIIPRNDTQIQMESATNHGAHISNDSRATIRDHYENPTAAPVQRQTYLDANLPGSAPVSATDRANASQYDNSTGSPNATGTPAVPGMAVPQRNPLADTLRGNATPPPNAAAPPTPSPAVTRPPMPVATDGHNTATILTGRDTGNGNSSTASRGPGSVPNGLPTSASTTAAPISVPSASPMQPPSPDMSQTEDSLASNPGYIRPDYMRGIVPSPRLNATQLEINRQKEGIDLDAKGQFEAADKVGVLNETVKHNRQDESRQMYAARSLANLQSAQAGEARQKTADAKNGTGGLLTSGGDGSGGDTSGNAVGVPSLQTGNLSKYDPRAIALVRGAIDPAMLIQLQRKDPPLAAQLLKQAMEIDPEFSTANYPMYKKTITDYGPSGAVGKQAASVNTAIDHLYNAYEQSKKLGNRSSSWYNFMANIVQAKFDPQLQEALADMGKKGLMAAKEVNKALSGGGQPGEKETEELHQNMGENDGPHAVRGAVGGAAALLAGRIREWNDAQTRQIGRSRPIVNLLSQAAADKLRIMQKEGVNVGDWGQMLDNPNTRTVVVDRQPGNTVTNQQQPTAFAHTATGPNGHKLGTNDDPHNPQTKWFDAQTGKPVN